MGDVAMRALDYRSVTTIASGVFVLLAYAIDAFLMLVAESDDSERVD
jgi:hypothetical protein